MIPSDALQQGRDAFARQAWADAHARLAEAERTAPLEPDDMERLATAAYLVGRDDESVEWWARAHHRLLEHGRAERAARCAFWLAFVLLNRGEHARAGGWLARARRLLDDGGHQGVEEGYLLCPLAVQRVMTGDAEGARDAFRRATEIGERFGDPDLIALARHGQGRALVRMGEVNAGMALLDEAMAAVEAGEVSAMLAGDIYCSVIEACQEIFDVRRAQQWTAALSRWCESQPDLVPYRGQCLVRRAELQQLRGDWPGALDESRRACEWLSRPPPRRAVGAAFYRIAELHRLRGELAEAEEAYRQASQWGREPAPGLALLRLAQGQVDAAEAASRRAVDEARDRRQRCALLPAHVEILLAAGAVAEARAAADELTALAGGEGDAPLPRALAAQAQGAVLLAEGDARAALAALRTAWQGWQQLEAPYEAARTRVLIGLACRELGDLDAAALELDAARRAFRQLGALPDLAAVEAHGEAAAPGPAHRLTPRELEVLRLVAAGETNKAIARRLFISPRTVDRHVSNILTKLDLPSRSAATAYAYAHALR